ncbi:MAG: OadG family protein [Bacteroidales bacterium]|nr:OadG family protein [Bacteroidales bacterium]MBN2763512.1 OadG family protein [Bacteroidales bacterium]
MIPAFDINPSAIDGNALTISVVGYVIVFLALVLLSTVFYYMPKLMGIRWHPKKKNTGTVKSGEALTGEVSAAISMALYLHFNQYHEEESKHLTIKRESRLYSPWSSKIYQVRNQFNRI